MPPLAVNVTTVGELKAALADLPDDMPIHRRGDLGDRPAGMTLVLLGLAQAKQDASYFADIENDEVWSKPKHRKEFGSAFKALCSF